MFERFEYSMKKIGFIGLGIMGKPMAAHLLHHGGFELYVNDVNQTPVDELVKEGAKASSLATIGKECEVIFTMLPNGDIVQQVLFEESGVSSQIKAGTIICDMSSVTPAQSITCAERLEEEGVHFLDAPVSGGEPGAVNATLSFMVGGEEEDFQIMTPYFDIMGNNAILVGKTGSGSIAKLANQLIVNNTIAVVSEAFVFATKAGADPEKVYQAIRGGLAGSAVLDAKIPMILDRNFKPGGSLAINHKDIKNVVNQAHAADIPIPYTAQLYEILQTLKIRGQLSEDHGSIIKYFESLAGCEVRKNEDR